MGLLALELPSGLVQKESAVEDQRVGGEGVEGKEVIHFPALSLLGQHGLVAVST